MLEQLIQLEIESERGKDEVGKLVSATSKLGRPPKVGLEGLGGLAEQSLIEGRAVNPLSCHPVQPNLTLKWDPRAIIVAMFFLHKGPTRNLTTGLYCVLDIAQRSPSPSSSPLPTSPSPCPWLAPHFDAPTWLSCTEMAEASQVQILIHYHYHHHHFHHRHQYFQFNTAGTTTTNIISINTTIFQK